MSEQVSSGKPISVEEAIKTALEFETRVRDTYKEAMDLAGDAVGKRVFGVLMKEEQGHLDYLNFQMDHLQKEGKIVSKKLESIIPPFKEIDHQVGKLQRHVEKDQLETEIKMLEKAVRVETETSDYYRGLVNTLKDESRAMFAQFLEIEEGHLALVQAELDAVQGNGFFFEFGEFNLEMG